MAENTEQVFVEVDEKFEWKPDAFNAVVDEATAYAEKWKANEGRRSKFVPSAFLNEGKYVFRIRPYYRKKDNMPAIIRRIFVHYLPETRPVLGNEEVTRILNNAYEAGVKSLWKHHAKETGLMMVHIYECPPSDYMKPGIDICLRLDSKEIFAIYNFLDQELKPNEKMDILNPNIDNRPIMLTVSGGGAKKQVSATVSAFGKALPLPKMKLPDDVEWKGMEEVYISDETGVIKEEELAKFRKYVAGVIADHAKIGNNVNPTTTGDTAGHQFTSSVQTTTTTSVSNDEKCGIVKKFNDDPELKKLFPNARFGNYPGVSSENPDDKSVECYICPFSSDCEKATLGQK